MYMYFVVGIWLLGLMETVLSIVFERQRKSNKLVYSLGIPGVISIGSLFAWLIVITLRYLELVSYTDDNATGLILISFFGAIALPVVFDLIASERLSSKFLWIINLVYFITIIVGVCFVYPTVMYFVK